MDHRAFIATLPPQQKAALHRRSDAAGLKHLAGHLGLLLAMGAYIGFGGPFWSVLLLPYGIVLMFLFTLSHECTHATPFARPWISDAVGHALSLPLLLPFTWFRYFHLAHHKYTNDPERDPEIAGHPRPTTWRDYLIYLSGWGYWTGNLKTLFRNAAGRIDAPYLPERRHARMRLEARILLALYAGLLLSLLFSPAVFWLWILPALLGQPFLRLYLLAEHGHCPPVANMLENTRTTLTNRAMRSLAWNMPFHAEHHAMPAVPFHALPALHQDMRAHLASLSPSYRSFTAEYLRKL